MIIPASRVGVNSGVGVGVGFNSNSNSGVGVGIGVEISGVGIGVGVDILKICRSWNWSWSWNLRSWSWSWYSGDWPELELELKPLELELELELILWSWPQPCRLLATRFAALPPQSPHCHLAALDHAKFFPPPLATRQARSYRANWATQTLLFSKPFDLAQVCHGNKICSKPAFTWKLTLVLAFPAHWPQTSIREVCALAYRIKSLMEFLGPILAKLH